MLFRSAPMALSPSYAIRSEFRAEGWAEEVAAGKRFKLPTGLAFYDRPGDGPMGQFNPRSLKVSEPIRCYSENLSQNIVLHLPPGRQLAELPKDVNVETANLTFTAHWSWADGAVELHRSFISDVATTICSGPVRSAASAAVKKIASSYDTELIIVPTAAKP